MTSASIPSPLQATPGPPLSTTAHDRSMTTTTIPVPHRPRPVQPSQARLLGALAADGRSQPLEIHRSHYPAPPAGGDGAWSELIDEVDRAGLRGRGGAGFPTARKMRTVAAGRRRPVVVANGTEGEPNSGKDHLLLTRAPHLVLDGALWAAAAVGADRVIVCVDRTRPDALAAMRHALAERAAAEPRAVDIDITGTPPRYVAGEETALVHWLNGGPAKPTATPPRPYERGFDGRPTLVQNVETLAHVAQIETRGADWFRQSGPPDEPGTALFTVSGAVARPSIVEAPIATTTAGILALAGGPSQPLQALLVGGFFGTWVAAAEAMDAPYSRTGLQPLGAAPGAGVIVALPAGACGMAETARIMAWYAAESAGQCGPCVFGLTDLAAGAATIAGATAHRDELDRLRRWADQIQGRGGCRHPDGAIRLLRSALTVFGTDLDRHLDGHACPGASARPFVHVPSSAPVWR